MPTRNTINSEIHTDTGFPLCTGCWRLPALSLMRFMSVYFSSHKPLSHLATNSSGGGLTEVLMPHIYAHGEKCMLSTYGPGRTQFLPQPIQPSFRLLLKSCSTLFSLKMLTYSWLLNMFTLND